MILIGSDAEREDEALKKLRKKRKANATEYSLKPLYQHREPRNE